MHPNDVEILQKVQHLFTRMTVEEVLPIRNS